MALDDSAAALPSDGRGVAEPRQRIDLSADPRTLQRLRAASHDLGCVPGIRPWNLDELVDLTPETSLRDAAVLLPLVRRGAALNLLLTRRTEHLTHHAGQISFPGGRVEPNDAGPLAAALRETEEEIGLPASAVDALGFLDPLATITGFRILPVVGVIDDLPPLRLDPNEVADVFEVPLSFVLDRAHQQRRQREFRGRVRSYHVIEYGTHHIWGATASMIVNLADRIEALDR
jgi:8-oxo-dGTP pyrophosphatase MutT (NUDIX family)